METNPADIVCIGDSITGWTQFSPEERPYPTYPEFLQERLPEFTIANAGIAGAFSREGVGHVCDALERFPAARYFIIGYGTNDLGVSDNLEQTSRSITKNLENMIGLAKEKGIAPVLINVPHVNESLFPVYQRGDLRRKREYHNHWLAAFCQQQNVPLTDICSRLKDADFADALHPNEQGAKRIAEAVYQILNPILYG